IQPCWSRYCALRRYSPASSGRERPAVVIACQPKSRNAAPASVTASSLTRREPASDRAREPAVMARHYGRHRIGTDTSHIPGYRRLMDEAEAVLERIERIQELDRADAPAEVLLGELRQLVVEAEEWARAEGDARARAATVWLGADVVRLEEVM